MRPATGVALTLAAMFGGTLGALWLYDRIKENRQVDEFNRELDAYQGVGALLDAAEQAQYVDLDGVDRGELRQFSAQRFMLPPPEAPVVMVGNRNDVQFATQLLGLNPARVIAAEYDWRVVQSDLDPGTRVIILSSAVELPQIGGIVANLRNLRDARFVRLVI